MKKLGARELSFMVGSALGFLTELSLERTALGTNDEAASSTRDEGDWLTMAELGPEARALLQAGRGVLRPTVADRRRVFEALSARIGAPTEPSVPSPVAPKAGLGLPALPAFAVGLAVAGAVATVALVQNTSSTPALAPARSSAPMATGAAPRASVDVAAPAATEVTARVQPIESGNARPTSARRPDLLGAEVAVLSRAATELHARHFASALKLLDEHARSFPHGTLTQERIAARVQALCGLGRVSEAKAELARLGRGSLQEDSAREACSVK